MEMEWLVGITYWRNHTGGGMVASLVQGKFGGYDPVKICTMN